MSAQEIAILPQNGGNPIVNFGNAFKSLLSSYGKADEGKRFVSRIAKKLFHLMEINELNDMSAGILGSRFSLPRAKLHQLFAAIASDLELGVSANLLEYIVKNSNFLYDSALSQQELNNEIKEVFGELKEALDADRAERLTRLILNYEQQIV